MVREKERGGRGGGSIEIRYKTELVRHENVICTISEPFNSLFMYLCIEAMYIPSEKGCVFLELRSTSLEVVQFQQKLSVCVFLGSRSVQCSSQETGSVGAQTLSVFRT